MKVSTKAEKPNESYVQKMYQAEGDQFTKTKYGESIEETVENGVL